MKIEERDISISTVNIIKQSNVLALKIRDKVCFIVFYQVQATKIPSPWKSGSSGHPTLVSMPMFLEQSTTETQVCIIGVCVYIFTQNISV